MLSFRFRTLPILYNYALASALQCRDDPSFTSEEIVSDKLNQGRAH